MTDDPASLDKLHDIVVPEPVSWWPMAPGWWLLLTLVSAFLLILAVRRFRRWRTDAYRRAALQELAKLESAEQVAVLLRRTALAIVPRESIAALHDDAWMAWIADRSPLAVPDSIRAALTRSLYAGEPAADLDELRNFAERWIRQHTRPC